MLLESWFGLLEASCCWRGADPVVMLGCEPDGDGVTGRFYDLVDLLLLCVEGTIAGRMQAPAMCLYSSCWTVL
ncbi:hypothetical protein Nepgr_021028 [Nepenthes gracilis]|uniref:Uncharacterized protein n=1 Tax=Nepenthes gracilis TaxID=150966 RepID=A0AAD3SZ26_NEPGR|nr:hypothetical protein Nepgr_021028 [Nepenthes gracilis]